MADRPIVELVNEAQSWREPLVLELADALEAEHKRAEVWRALAKRDGEHAVAVAEAERQRADAAIFCSEAEVARLTKENNRLRTAVRRICSPGSAADGWLKWAKGETVETGDG